MLPQTLCRLTPHFMDKADSGEVEAGFRPVGPILQTTLGAPLTGRL